jgi:hypothetical protein
VFGVLAVGELDASAGDAFDGCRFVCGLMCKCIVSTNQSTQRGDTNIVGTERFQIPISWCETATEDRIVGQNWR